jgi:hypothetical protein
MGGISVDVCVLKSTMKIKIGGIKCSCLAEVRAALAGVPTPSAVIALRAGFRGQQRI